MPLFPFSSFFIFHLTYVHLKCYTFAGLRKRFLHEFLFPSLPCLKVELKWKEFLWSIVFYCSSAKDTRDDSEVVVKKLSGPFQTATHAKRTYREIKLLKHLKHDNVRTFSFTFFDVKLVNNI